MLFNIGFFTILSSIKNLSPLLTTGQQITDLKPLLHTLVRSLPSLKDDFNQV